MSHIEKLLKEMEKVLDQLVENAEKLHELSKSTIDEDVLSSLQDRQEELLDSLVSLDEACHSTETGKQNKGDLQVNQRIQEKLRVFEDLNSSFVSNLMSSRGLIQFSSKESISSKQSKKVKKTHA